MEVVFFPCISNRLIADVNLIPNQRAVLELKEEIYAEEEQYKTDSGKYTDFL